MSLGMGPIRKWASVWCLAKLTHGGTPERATIALPRARACEQLTEDAVVADERGDWDSPDAVRLGAETLLPRAWAAAFSWAREISSVSHLA